MIIADATVLRLHEFLSDQFEARHEKQAGAKLYLLHNATEQTIERLDTANEKTHDNTLFKTGPWLENRLILFDLACFKYRQFALIDENDGYFISRLKQNANPVITAELREWRSSYSAKLCDSLRSDNEMTGREKEIIRQLSVEELDQFLAETDDEKESKRLTFIKRVYKAPSLADAADDVGKSGSTGSRWAKR